MAEASRAESSADHYLEGLMAQATAGPSVPLRLNLRPLAAMSYADATLVANGLIGSLGHVALEVDPVPREELAHLARSGVCFALANRTGPTRVSSVEVMQLDAWRESWSPGAAQPLRELFSAEELSETQYVPRLFSPYHAAFVQPHLAAAVGGGSEVTRVLRPWLLRIIPGKKLRLDPEFVADIGTLVEELVENVREHARRQPDGKPTCSLIDVSVTRGGHGNRINVSVQDTGPGIVATARTKLSAPAAGLSAPELVAALLKGEAGSWHRARGLGLPRVWDAVRERVGARISVATGVVRLDGSGKTSLHAEASSFDLAGTVVYATFKIPQ